MKTKNPPQPKAPGVVDQDYELVAVSKLKPHPQNPRKHHDPSLDSSIQQNGFYGAVVAQRSTGFILAGHARLDRAKAAGIASVPCLWLSVDDATALRILAGDNRTSDLAAQAGYDEEKLAALLTEVRTGSGGFEGTGYTEEQFNALLQSMGDALAGKQPGTGEIGPDGAPGVSVELPDLPTGDKPPFTQMTFTLHDTQAEAVKSAMQRAKDAGPFGASPNENSNGNALWRICAAYIEPAVQASC